ncbi:MAG: hypothetical protein L3K01_06080 [Thermoplasmata archaeon]|nr:hypothetical protein [Thermoplasmata archaeon]
MRPPFARQRALGGLPTLLAVLGAAWMVSGGLANGALAAPVLHWKAPYTGTVVNTKKHSALGCGMVTIGGDSFDRTTGRVSGGGSVKAQSCSSTTSLGSSGYEKLRTGILLQGFTGQNGAFTVRVKWAMTMDVDVSLSGSTCSEPNQFGEMNFEFAAGVLNETSNTPLGSAVRINHTQVTSPGSTTLNLATNVTLTMAVQLSTSDSYAISTGFSFWMTAQVDNPTTGDADSCTADARLSPSSGVNLTSLDYVQLL